jgi:hypothetical protein
VKQLKKILAPIVLSLMVNLVCAPATWTQQPSAKEEKRVRKIKKEIAGLGRWDDPVTVKLQNGTTVKGHIGEVAGDHFVVSDRDGRRQTNVDYSQVKDVSVGFGTRTKIGLAIAGGVFAILAVCLVSKGCRE